MISQRSAVRFCLMLALVLLLLAAGLPSATFWPATSTLALATMASTADGVVINELLASNETGLQDEDGDRSDWIELYNSSASPISLAGWSITDDPALPGKWIFPDVTLGSQQYLVVFASDKDRRPPPGEGQIHTNFKLGASGEYLGLYDAGSPRQVVDEYAPQFPQQYADVSYGRFGAGGVNRYFANPTPGAGNDESQAYLGVAEGVQFSHERGYYEAPIQVALSSSTPGAAIRYTDWFTAPSETVGRLYSGPIAVDHTKVLRAVAYKAGYLPSRVATHTYLYPDSTVRQPAAPEGFPATWGTYQGEDVVADYAMDQRIVDDPRYAGSIRNGLRSLPALSVVTTRDDMFGAVNGIYAHPLERGDAWERPASLEMINPDGSTAFHIDGGVRIHGGTSRIPTVTPKHSLRLYFRSDYGPSQLDYPLFPDSPVESFQVIVLRSIYEDDWLYGARALYVRDEWIRATQVAMGRPASHSNYVQLYIDGLYWGVYDVSERLDEAFAASHFGGSEDDFDIIEPIGAGLVTAEAGDTAAWDAMLAIAGQGLASEAQYDAIQQYLDVPNLIDYMLLHIYAGTYGDWLPHNWDAIRKREAGAGFMFLCWDNSYTLQYLDIDNTGLGPQAPGSPAYLYWRLRDNPEFRLLFADHVQRHFFHGGVFYVDPNHPVWDPANPGRNQPANRFMLRAQQIEQALIAESARWGDYALGGWEIYTLDDHWIPNRDWMLNTFFAQRSALVMQQLRNAGLYPAIDAPAFSQHGGPVGAGFQLAMSAPVGAIYYTVDGSDPRVYGTGAPSASASAYAAPVALPGGVVVVKARALSGGTWSALNEAIFTVPQDLAALRISEIMYNPAGGNDYEFIELKNTAALPLDVSGVAFVEGIDFTFPAGSAIEAGGFAVLANNASAFASLYPGIALAGLYTGRLDNGGEQLVLAAPGGAALIDMTYDDEAGWPTSPDGGGFSLVIVDPLGNPSDPANWRASTYPNGSPGQDDPEPFYGGVVIDEVLANSALPLEDAIELHNPTAQDIPIGGWFLSDEEASLQKYRIPDGAIIQAGGFKVFYEYQFNAVPGQPSSFSLPAAGGQVFLAAADAQGNLAGYTASAPFGAAPSGVSFGRHAASSGVDFTMLSRPTFGVEVPATVEEFRTGGGAANAYPEVGPVVIAEIMYNPAGGKPEFLELHNITDAELPLYDPAHPANTWQMTDGVAYAFPADTSLAARSYILLTNVDPATFRSAYAVPPAVPVFGPYDGQLSNGGELVELSMPGAPGPGVLPYIVVDAVLYDDSAPWPTTPDGAGPSLQRLSGSSYSNEPTNWSAGPVDGTPGQGNVACYFADVQPNADHGQPAQCDGDVDIADIQTVASCWNQPLASPGCPATLNLNGQGAFIDVSDVIAVAQRWDWPSTQIGGQIQ